MGRAAALEMAPPSVITVNRRSSSHTRMYTIVEESLLGFVLDTAPASVITVNRRSNSEKRLDTIVEESLLGLLPEADVASSFSAMSLSHWGSAGTGQSHRSYQCHGSSYFICAQ